MDSIPGALLVMLSGVVGIAASFRAPPPHRLSLVLLGLALIVGPVSPLLGDNVWRKTASVTAIALALVALANSSLVLFRRVKELRRHS